MHRTAKIALAALIAAGALMLLVSSHTQSKAPTHPPKYTSAISDQREITPTAERKPCCITDIRKGSSSYESGEYGHGPFENGADAAMVKALGAPDTGDRP